MIVYRVEDEYNMGPWAKFKTGLALSWDNEKHPVPKASLCLLREEFNSEIIVGVQTTELLLHWFYDCAETLVKNGFEVQVYEVPDEFVVVEELQVIFAQNKARKIN